MEAQAPSLLSGPAAAGASEPGFLAEAERFIAAHRGRCVFRALRWYTGCDEGQLDMLIGKIYCLSIPANTYAIPENPWKTYLGLFVLPFHYLATKNWRWTATAAADYDLEVYDRAHFERSFAAFYRRLRGSKRLTPHDPGDFGAETVTDPVAFSACLGDLLKLLVLAPLLPVPLALFALKTGVDITQNYRQALTIFTVFHGHFSRYPCRHYVTYADEINHPARYLGFRRACAGEFVAAQNGERIFHPMFAYGLVDRYFTSGSVYAENLKRLKAVARVYQSVGAPYINEYYEALRPLLDARQPPLYDLLFIDQGVYPHNGLNERSGRSLETIFRHLNEFKKRHPSARVVYQLRYWGFNAAKKEALLKILARDFTENIPLLENTGHGESYRNIIRSELVMTFESSMGFEAMAMGRKAVYVNFSGDPAESLCPDPRFQIDDPSGDYAGFEKKIEELLRLKLDGVPAVARERHFAFDGKVQERMADYLNMGVEA
ncbi:MAG: hypothetical protein HY923_09120 [Elusimicrobia bacterium]|nr:hypothetical protein [Elusimicrobiota bacterium]